MRAERLDQDTRLSRVVIARVVELPLACARANGAGQMRAERVGDARDGDSVRDVWTCVRGRWFAQATSTTQSHCAAVWCALVTLSLSCYLL